MNSKNILIAPSVLAADFSRLAEELHNAEAAGADMIQLDIMDGHFVPNISFGPGVSSFVTRNTSLPCEAHLMCTDPLFWAPRFAEIGCEYITFHDEVCENAQAAIEIAGKIAELGVKPCISYNPDNDLSSLPEILPFIDLVLIMTVFPGFAGQAFLPEGLENLRKAAEIIRSHLKRGSDNPSLRGSDRPTVGARHAVPLQNEIASATARNDTDTLLAVDGGIDATTAKPAIAAGADILVMGSAFFRENDREKLVKRIKGIDDSPTTPIV